MALVKHKWDKKEAHHPTSVRKPTCAQIVEEARHTLRTLNTQRPFTPWDEKRHLFGNASHCPLNGRPSSTFRDFLICYSLNSWNFEVPHSKSSSVLRLSPMKHKIILPPSMDKDNSKDETNALKPSSEPKKRDSRPCLALRLSPMEYKQKLALYIDEADSKVETYVPKPPAEPLGRKDRKAGFTRHFKAASPSVLQRSKEASCSQAEATGGDESEFWNTEVLPILDYFETVVPGDTATEETFEYLCSACNHLYDVLSEKCMLGRQFKKKSHIQKALLKLIDFGSDQLTLSVAKLMLALNVSGNNLLNICKLVFIVSRNPSNDFLFQNNSILDYLLLLLQFEDLYKNGEVILYSVGTLKLLSGNSDLSRQLLDKDFIPVLLGLSQRLVQFSDPKEGHDLHAMAGHLLVQSTAALRNMADVSESLSVFLANNVFSTLCMVMDHYLKDQDLCLNMARIFSKLSSYSECCYALAETPRCYSLFLDMLSKHGRKQALSVRLLFTLGNVAARSEKARKRLFEEEGGIETLLGIFQQAAPTPSKPQDVQRSHKDEDVLIKVIGVLANLAIYPAAGIALAANTLCVKLLLEVMEAALVDDRSVLVTKASATINNLLFYREESSVVRAQHKHISELLLRLLLSCNIDAVVEATRAFGNLSQIKSVQQFIFANKVHKIMVVLLDSKNVGLCYSACGVLVNLSVDANNRKKMRKAGAINGLIKCLRDLGPVDWELSGLVCQALWNCMDDRENYTQDLLEILTLYSDHEALQWPSEDDAKEHHKACWELEFLPVAEKLKKRIENCDSCLETISEPS